MILNIGTGSNKGNQVNITPTLTQGIKIADYSIDDVSGELYAPQDGINYSTEEQDTGLTWIDGKKIYQKSFNISNITPINSEYVIIDNIDTLILHNLMFSDSAYQNGAWFILSSYTPFVNGWFYGDLLYLNSNNQLIFRIDGKSGILSLKGTIQYTKSTE